MLNMANVPELAGRSYQRWMIRQPIKLGGLGLRSLVDTCAAAFVGGIEMAIPHMVGVEGKPASVVGQVTG